MMTESDFHAQAQALSQTNATPLATAERYLAVIGDTPELSQDGRVVVRDRVGNILAHVIMLTDS